MLRLFMESMYHFYKLSQAAGRHLYLEDGEAETVDHGTGKSVFKIVDL